MNFLKKINLKENQRGILTSIQLFACPLYSIRTLQVNILKQNENYLHNLKS